MNRSNIWVAPGKRQWGRAIAFIAIAGVALLAAGLFFVHELRWRVDVVAAKAKGEIEDIGWKELAVWLRPGSGLYLEALSAESNPYAALSNPYTSDADHAAGEGLFVEHCSICHGGNGEGKSAPSLIDRVFKFGDSDWALFRTMTRGIPESAMPSTGLSEREAWQVLTHLKRLRMAAPVTSSEPHPVIPSSFAVSSRRLEQSADEPQNWLTYSGAYNGWRHSALRDINTANVDSLKLAWSLQLKATDRIETSPIVVDGVMFISEPPSNVLAVDAASGRVIWTYNRSVPMLRAVCCGRVNRGVAVIDDQVFVGALDGELVALDARTGAVHWKTVVADPAEGYSLTGAPLAVAGLVVVGVAGGDYGTRGFLDAYDAMTGARKWRFYTVPSPGESGSDTWSGDAWRSGGGATWVTGAFDPALGLLYWGVGNPAPDFNGDVRPGDNLYTNSVIALRIATGELVWHFQFTPHDEHDWDSNQVPVLVDRDVDGRMRQLLLWANRNGFYYVIDRTNGEFLHARAFVKQTWANGVDPRGRPLLIAGSQPSARGTLTWPGVQGGANWWSPSYSAAADTFFSVAVEQPSVFSKGTGAETSDYHAGNPLLGSSVVTDPSEPLRVVLRALDPLSGEQKWEKNLTRRNSLSEVGGVLSTLGNVVFLGDRSEFVALDAVTGAELWRVNLGGVINANPVTFAVNGRQLVTISAGNALFSFGL